MTRTVWGVVAVMLAMAVAAPAAVKKSKTQAEQETAWADRIKALKVARGEVDYFKFLGLEIGGAKLKAMAVMAAAKLQPVDAPTKVGQEEVVLYDGNHQLKRVKQTMLEFFADQLIRVTMRFVTTDAELTFTALQMLLEEKHGEMLEDKYPGYAKALRINTDQGACIFLLLGKTAEGGGDVVIVVHDAVLLEKRRDAQIEAEKKAIGAL